MHETFIFLVFFRLFIWDRLRKLTEQPYEPETKLRLNQHLNTGVTGLCDSAVGMCVEVGWGNCAPREDVSIRWGIFCSLGVCERCGYTVLLRKRYPIKRYCVFLGREYPKMWYIVLLRRGHP